MAACSVNHFHINCCSGIWSYSDHANKQKICSCAAHANHQQPALQWFAHNIKLAKDLLNLCSSTSSSSYCSSTLLVFTKLSGSPTRSLYVSASNHHHGSSMDLHHGVASSCMSLHYSLNI